MSDHVECLFCGGKILDDHDAELLERSGDLVHAGCRRDAETPDADDQGTLSEWSA